MARKSARSVTLDLYLAPASALISGTPGDDSLAATGDGDFVYGLGGNDTLTSMFNDVLLDGGIGDDLLEMAASPALGSGGLDHWIATGIGGLGNDTITATIDGGFAFGDVLIGTALYGGGGDDRISARLSIGSDDWESDEFVS
ncbi:MAG TPA: hypothetical protein VFR34_14330, partial [Paracoccaceae bacterium]|nr:hypothetical protein [Paracoccaceae bacterium]